jgi:tRNA(Ile)-lysidine synthase TilS/MesJ
MNGVEREIDKRVTRAVFEYGLIEEGDRILLALSGGKDSLTLAWNLARKAAGFPIRFEVEALHLATGFEDAGRPEEMRRLLDGWDMKFRVVEHPSSRDIAPGRPPDCFSCSRGRRRALLEEAARGGFSKVALGHHMDDSLITLLMNMSWNAELAAMPPMVRGRDGSPSIIRPLILVQESAIIRLVSISGWNTKTCRCPWAGDSRRTACAAVLRDLTGGSTRRMWNMWRSLSNITKSMLPRQESGKPRSPFGRPE